MRAPTVSKTTLAVHAALEQLVTQQIAVGASLAPPSRVPVDRSPVAPAPASLSERIVALIAVRPGIRNAEIADELDIAADLVRPLIQARLANSQIIADMVPASGGQLISAYRLNAKWTPADADFVPAPRAADDDAGDDVAKSPRATGPGSRTKARAKPGAKAAARPAAPVKRKYVRKTPLSSTAPPAGSPGGAGIGALTMPVEVDHNFTCALLHDGRAVIKTTAGTVALTSDQAAAVARHLSRFHVGPAPLATPNINSSNQEAQ